MSKTVVGLFNSNAEAQKVKQTLVSNGYESSKIKVVAQDADDDDYGASDTTGNSVGGYSAGTDTTTGSSTSNYGTATNDNTTTGTTGTGTGVGEKISNFFKSLTGGDEDVHHHYATGVNTGGALLSVTTSDEDASSVASLLRQHGARDIEGGGPAKSTSGMGSDFAGTAGYGTTGSNTVGNYNNMTTSDVSGQTAIPIVEEELVVGKREVDRGGVRIYSHVTETPVDADVTLRDERVNVTRRAVDRPATAADFQAGNAASYELRATGEEAVVGKSSRVVEEVLVGKQSSEHTEAIHDSVRKTEVEVEQIAGDTTKDTTGYTDKNRF